MSTRGGQARPATVKIIETVHVEADRSSFKSVVQRLTGRDAVVGDWSDGSERRSNEAAAAAQGAGYVNRQDHFADRHSCRDDSS
ncbi:hypothetical protein BS78_03G214800 [Paspalum vaginatum]|nr:hypothetical protein BS78_03G214800 [Paspalum vaginatum]